MSTPTISILMATYAAERESNLKEALESIYVQTRPPEQIVLVLDGPVGDAQEAVIASFEKDPRVAHLDVVKLEQPGGLARALNAGLTHCTGDLIARMDSDDICLPDRLELQIAAFNRDPTLDLVGSWSEEFFEDGMPSSIKICPTRHDAIIDALRWRNVLTHPSVVIRANVLRRIGGYSTQFGKLEDYDLYVRLALSGARFHAIPKVLVRTRSGLGQRARRGGFRYLVHEIKFRTELFRRGFLRSGQFLVTTALYAVFRLTTAHSRKLAYFLVRR